MATHHHAYRFMYNALELVLVSPQPHYSIVCVLVSVAQHFQSAIIYI